jgi:hypothetical protein
MQAAIIIYKGKADGFPVIFMIYIKYHRASLSICPSAQDGINISELIYKYCTEDYYKKDFEIISETLINEDISYSEVLATIKIIANFDFW